VILVLQIIVKLFTLLTIKVFLSSECAGIKENSMPKAKGYKHKAKLAASSGNM